MSDDKRKALEAAGWKFGSVHEFLEEPKMNVAAAVSDSISIARATAARREDYQRAACVLSAEVERLRAELDETKRWLDERSEAYGKTCSIVDQLQTELAAAKAASVCPVGITDLALCGGGQRIEFYIEGDKSDGAKMLAWLRDRMKGGEG